MRWFSLLVSGALTGMAFLLCLYGLVLLSLWGLALGEADPVTSVVLDEHPALVIATVLKFLLLNLLSGGVLGVFSAFLTEVLIKPNSRAGRTAANLFMGLAVFLYLNARFMVMKPMFYDPLMNAQGGAARWIQNTLCTNASPAGVDVVFAVLLAVCIALRWGARIRVRRTTAAASAGGLLLLGPVMALGISAAHVAAPSEKNNAPSSVSLQTGTPNILILGFDSLRPDHLSCGGYHRKTSPHIDRLAEKGVFFDEAYVPLARTLPSWTSLFTSTYPHTHGFRHMFPAPERRSIHLPLLPRILSNAGYATSVVSDYAGECFDMVNMGFDRIDVPPATSLPLVIEREFMQRQPYLAPFLDYPLGHRLLPLLRFMMINGDARRLSDRVIDAMDSLHASGKPFFITAFFSSVHIPYAAPYPFYKKYTDPEYEGIHKYGFGVSDPRQIQKALERPKEEDQRQIIDLYDGAVAASDEAVGRIVEALEERGLWDNTWIIITADHGENLYDHGNLLEHGERFGGGDAANRFPLIFASPGADFPARHINLPVSALDFAPTLLSLTGLPIPPEARGRDLTPLLEGRTLPEAPLFGETGLWLAGTPESMEGSDLEYPSILYSLSVDPLDLTLYLRREYEERVVTAKQRQIRYKGYKLIYSPTPEGARFHLFDVQNDPGNQQDLYGDRAFEKTAEDLKRRLFEWMLSAPGCGLDPRLHLVKKYTFFE